MRYEAPEAGVFEVEREDGTTRYREWRYAKARFDAPGSSWAKLSRWIGCGIDWAYLMLWESRGVKP